MCVSACSAGWLDHPGDWGKAVKAMGEQVNTTFPQHWKAQVLPARPLILPPLHRVYPLAVEEVERGALEVMVTPANANSFLATCALGFNAASLPSGLWSCPDPDWLCAIAGGYAYLINTTAPEIFEQVEFKPVVAVVPVPEAGLLVFASFHTLVAYGKEGKRWKTQKLTSEGVRLGDVVNGALHGWGWDMRTDRELPFVIDLATGEHSGGVQL
jgi:hypothetical protein